MLNYKSKKENQNGRVRTGLELWLFFAEAHCKTNIVFSKARASAINIRAWFFFFFSVLREKEYIQVHTQLVNGRQLFPFGGENIVFISVSNTNIPINMFIVLLLISAKFVFIGVIRV